MKSKHLFSWVIRFVSLASVATLLLACSAQNNITFSTIQGNCSDGSTNAPYCMGITIQNNAGGQNWITNTNYPISNLTLTVSGPSNVGYPTSSGSSYDPNNCLGSTLSGGQTCTFYLWLLGESAAVGTKPPVVVSATYNIEDTLFGGSSNTSTSTVTVYETPGIVMSNTSGTALTYSSDGFSGAYRSESSETIVNAVNNDNYYGFLYTAGNNGIYTSGNWTYVSNVTQSNSSIKGGSNILINGQTIYATPSGSSSASVYSAGIAGESFSWQQYATNPTTIAYNVNAMSGSQLFFTPSTSPSVYLCNQNSSSGSSCTAEGVSIPGATTINVLGFTTLGTANGSALTGLVAGASNGLWVESGTLGQNTNQWLQVTLANGTAISTSISKIVADGNLNLYIADLAGNFYELAVNGSNLASQITGWVLPSGEGVAAMVFDNGGQQMYIGASSGNLYACAVNGSCAYIGNSGLGNLASVNLVTALTAS